MIIFAKEKINIVKYIFFHKLRNSPDGMVEISLIYEEEDLDSKKRICEEEGLDYIYHNIEDPSKAWVDGKPAKSEAEAFKIYNMTEEEYKIYSTLNSEDLLIQLTNQLLAAEEELMRLKGEAGTTEEEVVE